MKWGSMIGWGIVIYAIMYLFWNGLALYGFVAGVMPRILMLAMLIIVATIATRALRYTSAKDIAPYSLAWAIIVILLDIVFTVPYTGFGMFSDWNVWVGYAIVFLAPLFVPYVHGGRAA